MAYLRRVTATYDSDALDAFGRLPVAEPTTLFDAQFTYDLQPLLYEEIKSGTGADVTHDATDRRAIITFSSTPTGNKCALQTYEHFRYQPGKAQQIYITGNIGTAVTNTRVIVGYYSYTEDVGFYFSQESNGDIYVNIQSQTTVGGQAVIQSSWNLDKLDGTGTSGKTLNITKDQIFYIDFQALYVGRVRFGVIMDGELIFCHEFLNANVNTAPYIDSANLPIFFGMTSSGGTVTRNIYFNCCSVISSGGVDETVGYEFTTPDTSVTAGSGTRTHLVSLRPRTTFNSITNRSKLAMIEIDLIVTGNNPVYCELCLGQTFSVAPTYSDVNTTYSAFEYGTGGTLSGSPSIVIDSGYVPATASQKGATNMLLTSRYPITLDYAGAVRSLGTITLLVRGLGGTSVTRGVIKFKEIR